MIRQDVEIKGVVQCEDYLRMWYPLLTGPPKATEGAGDLPRKTGDSQCKGGRNGSRRLGDSKMNPGTHSWTESGVLLIH